VGSRSVCARLFLLVVAPLALPALSGCIGGPSTPPVPPAKVITGLSARPADPSAVKAASEAALAAYQGYLTAYVAAARSGDWNSQAINRYAADPARTQAHLTLRTESESHLIHRGEPVSTPRVSVVNVGGSNDAVSISDCIDATGWRLFDQRKNAYVTQSPLRYTVTVLVVEYPGTGWLVQQVDETTTPC